MIGIKYSIFSAISIFINLLFQNLTFRFYNGLFSIYVAIFFGTSIGLITKYILDKKWIFYHISRDKKDDTKKFILYSLTGIFTTTVFLVLEMMFYYISSYSYAKYIGGAIGLAIGYTIKYFLDSKYVFYEK